VCSTESAPSSDVTLSSSISPVAFLGACSLLAFHPLLLPIAGALNSFGWGYAVAASCSPERR
jgi:hypothetical protein